MTNPTDPAFPVSSGGALFDGLTKRELFAAMAMQGMLASPDPMTMAAKTEKICEWSVNAADMLIEALEKEQVRA